MTKNKKKAGRRVIYDNIGLNIKIGIVLFALVAVIYSLFGTYILALLSTTAMVCLMYYYFHLTSETV